MQKKKVITGGMVRRTDVVQLMGRISLYLSNKAHMNLTAQYI